MMISDVADGGYVADPFSVLNQIAIPHDVAAPVGVTDFGAMAQNLLEAVQNRQWALVASLGVIALIASARRFIPDETKVGGWLHSPVGGLITNFGLSFGGAFSTAIAAGQPINTLLLLKALNVALMATGVYETWAKSKEAIADRKAQAAGAVAAKKPDDTLNK